MGQHKRAPDAADQHAYCLGQPEVGLRTSDPLERASTEQRPDPGGKEITALKCGDSTHSRPIGSHLDNLSEREKPTLGRHTTGRR
jgi:hypothetical protein